MRNACIPLAAAVLVWAVPAVAQDTNVVALNETGKTIKAIEVSLAGKGEWKDNMIDKDPNAERVREIGDKGKMTVFLDAGDNCKFDFRGTFKDGSTAIWSNINVCDYWRVHLVMKGEATSFTYN